MQKLIIKNVTCPITAQINARLAKSFWQRFKGLMFQASVSPQQGLLIDEGQNSQINSAIHMLFMRFDITAVWINDSNEVVDVRLAKKWQPAILPAAPARYILETHVDRIHDFQPGDKLSFEEI